MGNFPQFDILCIFFTNVNILTIIDKNRSVSALFYIRREDCYFGILFLYDNISVIIIERKCMF